MSSTLVLGFALLLSIIMVVEGFRLNSDSLSSIAHMNCGHDFCQKKGKGGRTLMDSDL